MHLSNLRINNDASIRHGHGVGLPAVSIFFRRGPRLLGWGTPFPDHGQVDSPNSCQEHEEEEKTSDRAPRRLLSGPVEYALRAILLGGYVGFPDDDPESGFAPDDPDLLRNRPVPDRLLVVSAGVAANLAFAFAFLVVYEQTLTVVPRRWLGHGCGGHGGRRASDEDVTA
ncbi:Membrane metalloprotease ARASP chloroplastic [Zea mays]|uniref:Membrane metalloprotease ARASP chloroplastic n=1 Tax=Zea mays TaxID=4577 RepID=A0A1D6IGR9_MAIZE|nr:Membrane metalloprotease ARASP chloroplastic [Zea mays]